MSPREEERVARAALSRLGEPGDLRLSALVRDLGAVVVRDALAEQRDLEGLLDQVATRLVAMDPERDLEVAARQGIRFVIPGDAEWPKALDDLAHGGEVQRHGGVPLGLWVRGPLPLDQLADSVAVVGSRSATAYGEKVANDLAMEVAAAGVAVVSGAAFGIDYAAHRGALRGGGRTVAVLACGVDRAYPVAHAPLLDHLASECAVISELPPGCAPTRIRFLVRNRLIAALSRGTVVVEAAVRSGALSTAHWADRLSRTLMAVPGPVTAAQSGGTHQLVRHGAAQVVTSGRDVLELVGASGTHLVTELRAVASARDALPATEARVLEAVPVVRAAPVDSISRAAGLGLLDVQRSLHQLERLGMVVREGAGWRLGEAART